MTDTTSSRPALSPWMIAGICVLLALVVLQGALLTSQQSQIAHLTAQLAGVATQSAANHRETLTTLRQAVALGNEINQKLNTSTPTREVTIAVTLCAELRVLRAYAKAQALVLPTGLQTPHRGYIVFGGCRLGGAP